MNLISRGVRNAFRNVIRTVSIVIILGLSIGLCLTMLLARQAVEQKINNVKGSIGNTITISPAGFSSFSQANNALTTGQINKVKSLPHITGVTETLTDRLTTIGSSQPSFPFGGSQSSNTNNQTSLKSPVQINLDTNRSGSGGGFHVFINGGGSLPSNFSPPITIIGTNDPSQFNQNNGNQGKLVSGQFIDGNIDTNEAMVSTTMASKNNLKVGSTFTAYGATLTVHGVYDTSTAAGNDAVIVSLPTEQRLSGQSGDVTSTIATVDSIDNLSSTTTAIKNTLGSAADVTNSQIQANNTITPLNSVKTISLFSLVGATVAGAIIIFLVMVMIVRERHREIGVLKAIGGSNAKIMLQFICEAITLTVLGAVIGLIIGVIGGTPVTKLLVNNSTTTSSSVFTSGGGSSFQTRVRSTDGFGGFGSRFRNNSIVHGASNIHAAVGWSILLYGFGAAIIIAVVGSALASILIAKIRPAEVLRTE